MPENTGKYGLAKAFPKALFKGVRNDTATDPDSIDDKRVLFARKGRILAEIIKHIQELNDKLPKASPEEKMAIGNEIQEWHTVASLQGLMGLYDGLGLSADINCVELFDEDPSGGERSSTRLPLGDMIFDLCRYFRIMIKLQAQQASMLRDIGAKQEAFGITKYPDILKKSKGKSSEGDDLDDDGAEQTLDQPAPIGIPVSKMKDMLKVTPEDVEKEIKGR
jgi:hypothetical protein